MHNEHFMGAQPRSLLKLREVLRKVPGIGGGKILHSIGRRMNAFSSSERHKLRSDVSRLKPGEARDLLLAGIVRHVTRGALERFGL